MTTHTKKIGHRLSDPRDPVVRAALGRTCPTCRAKPEQWCVGIAEGSRTKGRTLSRIHSGRCKFNDYGPDGKIRGTL